MPSSQHGSFRIFEFAVRWSATVGLAASLAAATPRPLEAQQPRASCSTDRVVSTLVGAGLAGAVAAIPATIVHRHDQTSSHRIVAVSFPAGALIGFLAAGRDRPCAPRADSLRGADDVVAGRSSHAGRGAVVGAVIGGVAGVVGSTFLQTGCERDPCHATATRVSLAALFAGEGAIAGGILGGLIGWVWPMRR